MCSDLLTMRRSSTERIEQFAWLEYLFLECNHIICIFSLLVVCNVTIWCKWFFWTRVLDITGYTGHTLELIAFDNAVNYLRPLHVPNLTKLTTSYSNPQYCLIWIDWNFAFQKQPPEVFYKKVFLQISQNSHKTTCVRISFSIKWQVSIISKVQLS